MIRAFVSLLLAIVLALTSQSLAVARGAAAASGQMVICTGTGPIAVYVDAQGQPTAAPHMCPDATLQVVTEVPASVLRGVLHLVAFVHRSPAVTLAAPRPPRIAQLTRGPPLMV